MREPDDNPAFSVQADVRAPWRRFLDALAPLRPTLHRYCCKLTGNVWDGEDLMQDALLRVFGLLGKIDADLEHPKAYFIRTARICGSTSSGASPAIVRGRINNRTPTAPTAPRNTRPNCTKRRARC